MPIALFDFDGTITAGDSFIQFIRFTKGNLCFWKGILLNSPALLAFKLGIISNQKAKEIVFNYFFKGTAQAQLLMQGETFARKIIAGQIRPEAREQLDKFKSEQVPVVIVSASFSFCLQSWCSQNEFDLIATEHETIDGFVTGKIKGINCRGTEKARKILDRYKLNEMRPVYAFGDRISDIPMLDLADYKWLKWTPYD